MGAHDTSNISLRRLRLLKWSAILGFFIPFGIFMLFSLDDYWIRGLCSFDPDNPVEKSWKDAYLDPPPYQPWLPRGCRLNLLMVGGLIGIPTLFLTFFFFGLFYGFDKLGGYIVRKIPPQKKEAKLGRKIFACAPVFAVFKGFAFLATFFWPAVLAFIIRLLGLVAQGDSGRRWIDTYCIFPAESDSIGGKGLQMSGHLESLSHFLVEMAGLPTGCQLDYSAIAWKMILPWLVLTLVFRVIWLVFFRYSHVCFPSE